MQDLLFPERNYKGNAGKNMQQEGRLMKRISKATAVLITLALVLGMLSACSKTGTQENSENTVNTADVSKIAGLTLPEITEEDNEQVISTENAAEIVFNGDTAAVHGTGASVSGSTVTVKQAGTYLVTGETEDGQLVVNAGDDDTVKLVFQNASITSGHSAAVFVQNAGKTILNAAENSVNTLTDAANYTDQVDGEPDSTVYSKDDLTINGYGAFQITGNYNDAIKSKDTLVITGSTLQISSVDDGIIGKDYILMNGGTADIDAAGDGMKSTYDTDTSKGAVAIYGGSLNITSGADGIQATTKLLITGGNMTITAGGGSTQTAAKAEAGFPMGGFADTQNETDSTGSYKGLKSGYYLEITGGTFDLNCADDTVHCNNTIVISDGTFTLKSGDDGIHADTLLQIDGGTITVETSYEGLEAAQIDLNGGEMRITASDDGVNAAGGNDTSNENGPMGGDSFGKSTGTLNITGGNIWVDASGDGLDSNGNINMSGGTVLVNGPNNGADGALDYDGTFQMTGGTLAAAGAVGMAQTISSSSSVYSVSVGVSGAAGTAVRLLDSNGEELLSFAPAKSFSNVVLATPLIEQNGQYTITTAAYSGGSDTNGLLQGASYTSETTVGTFTASTVLSSVGTQQGMMDGGDLGGKGGDMQQPDGNAPDGNMQPDGNRQPNGGRGGMRG